MATDTDFRRFEAPASKTVDLKEVFGQDLYSARAAQMNISPSDAGFIAMTEAHIDSLTRSLRLRDGELVTTLRSTEKGRQCLAELKRKLTAVLAAMNLKTDEIQEIKEALEMNAVGDMMIEVLARRVDRITKRFGSQNSSP